MNINTEAAELLHAVADLYECGALKWQIPSEPTDAVMGITIALVYCGADYKVNRNSVIRAVAKMADLVGDVNNWQRRKDRTVKDVIALLRRAAQGLEEACLTYT